MKRVFLIILDSCGAGAMPDAAAFGDVGAHTLRTCYGTGKLDLPNLIQLGLGNIDGLSFLGKTKFPAGAAGRMAEASQGKDTTIGHWELAGLISDTPLPTYPNGFPKEILEPFCRQTGRGVLANAPWSGTQVIEQYGQAHLSTGDLIVYTSADSVFQIAAHEEIVPPEELYRYCQIARDLLQGKHGVGRVIARPFIGTPGKFIRTANRRDFSLKPPKKTLLDVLQAAGLDTLAVGKISDIFAGSGITQTIHTKSNAEGMACTSSLAKQDFQGLCFVNLVEFDMLYGHRRDPEGYAKSLTGFDRWLGEFLPQLQQEDALIITADHGCDPGYTATTDHTREYVPLLVAGKQIRPVNLGTRQSFSDVSATVADLLGVQADLAGTSFAKEILL